MATSRIVKTVQRWIWREVKVLGLYSLWRSLGGTLWLVVSGLLLLGVVKYFAVTPPESFFVPPILPQSPMFLPSPDLPSLQRRTVTFFQGLPYVGPVWESLPLFDHRQPWTYVAWGSLLPFSWLGVHLLRRKVKDDPTMAAVTVLGSVGVVNTGTMAVKRVESIAAQLTRISSLDGARVAPAIAHVTKAVAEAPTPDEAQRTDRLELLAELARQAALPAAERSPTVGRMIVRTLDAALSRVANLADIWSAWGPTIKAFFDVSD